MTLKSDRNKGFTLVELLVAILIGAILMIGVVSMFIQQSRAMALQEDLVNLEQNLRSGMDLLYRDVRMSGAYVKESMPTFTIGPFKYFYTEASTDFEIPLESDGNPDALSLSYSDDVGLSVTNGTSSSNSVKICNDSSVSIDKLVDENKLPISNGGKAQLIEITNITSLGGDCFNVVFSPGQSPINNSSGVSFDLVPGGRFWSNIQAVTYYVDLNYNGEGVPVLMRGVNNQKPEIVSFGITNLQVEYGVEVDVGGILTIKYTTDPAILGAEINDTHIVRLTLTGETRGEHALGGVRSKRTRTMTTEVQVRNLFY